MSADITDMGASSLFMGLFTGLIGAGYFMYGKRRERIMPMLVGVAMIIVPYFLDGWVTSAVVTGVLCAIPFFVAL